MSPEIHPALEGSQLLRMRSDPALTGSHRFNRTVGLAATVAYLDLQHQPNSGGFQGVPDLMLTPPTPKGPPPIDPSTLQQFLPVKAGFGRNPGGGVWTG